MTTRIELDFRHGLTEPRVDRSSDDARLSLTRGQEQVVLRLPKHALLGIWMALAASLQEPDPC